jgi:thiosulfate reductase cytochrome b subunit
LSISSTGESTGERGYVELLGWRIDTTGLFGVQHTDTAPVEQAFPGWMTIPSYYWLAGGRHFHFFFAWVFVLNGGLYVIYNLVNGHMRKFFLTPRDVAKIPAMALYYLRLRKESPQEGEYNPMQKMGYTGVLVLLTPLIILSGMAMSPQLNQAFHWLPALFGGRQSARTFHFILTFAFAGFVFGHVFMVLTTGVFNNMRSMISGWYREKIATAASPQAASVIQSSIEPAAASAAEQQPLEASAVDTVEQKQETAEKTLEAAEKSGGKNGPH